MIRALDLADQWEKGCVQTGVAMKAAREVHAYARSLDDPVDIAIVRAVGHAVATAHMADHSSGAALYALKALKLHGCALDEEKTWQRDQLPR